MLTWWDSFMVASRDLWEGGGSIAFQLGDNHGKVTLTHPFCLLYS